MPVRRLAIGDVALPCANLLGETPFWSGREASLYWVDLRAPALHRLRPESGEHRQWRMPDLCTGAVPAAGGGIVIALRHTLMYFDPDTTALAPLAEIEPASHGNRLNETRCDRAGRLWVGSMRDFGAAVTGSLYVVGEDLAPRKVLSDIRVPNSLGWSPDDGILYFADTAEKHIHRYCFDVETGVLGQALAPIGGDVPGGPDGSAVDAQGYIWNTRYGAGLVVCIDPDGAVVETIEMPVTQPTACAFGGTDLKTLYITTASQRLDAAEIERQPLAGHLFQFRVEVPGLPEPAFRFRRKEQHDDG